MSDYSPLDAERNARVIAGRVELAQLRNDAWAERRPDHIDLLPPPYFVHPVTGRHVLDSDPEMLIVGRYVRRARRYSGKSQHRLALDSNVSQSMVSRTERGLAPGMRLERFVAIAESLGRLFPLGMCPHDHECAWQPIKPPEHQATAVERLLAILLAPDTNVAEESDRSVILDNLLVGSVDDVLGDKEKPQDRGVPPDQT